jgi:hypothetical protein
MLRDFWHAALVGSSSLTSTIIDVSPSHWNIRHLCPISSSPYSFKQMFMSRFSDVLY